MQSIGVLLAKERRPKAAYAPSPTRGEGKKDSRVARFLPQFDLVVDFMREGHAADRQDHLRRQFFVALEMA
jgi:hypothetical protein